MLELVENPEDRFSHNEAHIIIITSWEHLCLNITPDLRLTIVVKVGGSVLKMIKGDNLGTIFFLPKILCCGYLLEKPCQYDSDRYPNND